MLTVFVVDDERHVREALAAVVDATAGFRVVGSASDGCAALDRVEAIDGAVDIVLLDVQLGGTSGVDVAAHLLERWPRLVVAYVSMLDEEDLPDGPETPQVLGLIPKSTFGPAALAAIRTAVGRLGLT